MAVNQIANRAPDHVIARGKRGGNQQNQLDRIVHGHDQRNRQQHGADSQPDDHDFRVFFSAVLMIVAMLVTVIMFVMLVFVMRMLVLMRRFVVMAMSALAAHIFFLPYPLIRKDAPCPCR